MHRCSFVIKRSFLVTGYRLFAAMLAMFLSSTPSFAQTSTPPVRLDRACDIETSASLREMIASALAAHGLSPTVVSRLTADRSPLIWNELLPRLTFRVGQSHGLSSTFDFGPRVPDQLDGNSQLRTNWQVGATWNMARLFKLSTPLERYKTMKALLADRRELVDQITELHTKRCVIATRCGLAINKIREAGGEPLGCSDEDRYDFHKLTALLRILSPTASADPR